MKMKFLTSAVMAASLLSVGFANAQSVEPTKTEMQDAFVTKLKALINEPAVTVGVVTFEKDTCEAAKDKEGAFVCTFTAALDIQVPNAPENDKKPVTAKGLFEKNKDGAWEATPM